MANQIITKNLTVLGSVSCNNLSNPNILINSDFRINQRGATNYDNINGSYTVDRWRSHWARYLTVNSDNSLTITTEGYGQGICQTIEHASLYSGKTVTLSAKLQTNKGGRIVISVNGAWTVKEYFGTSVQTPTLTMTLPTLTDNDTLAVFLISPNNIGTTTTYYWAKLELGSVATPFVPRPYAEELLFCQRYYQRYTDVFGMGQVHKDNSIISSGRLINTMRVIPTVTLSGEICCRSGDTYSDITGLSERWGSDTKSYQLIFNIKDSLPVGACCDIWAWNGGIEFDAEIY